MYTVKLNFKNHSKLNDLVKVVNLPKGKYCTFI